MENQKARNGASEGPNLHDSTSQESSSIREAIRAYETLLSCRDLELNLHVQRSNLCLVVEGALLAFVAPALLTLKADAGLAEKAAPLIIALGGITLSAICIPIVKGASFWVSYWECRPGEVEDKVLPSIPIFRDHPSAHNPDRLRRLPEHLSYTSSRKAMLVLFQLLTGLWLGMVVFVLVR